MQLNAVQMPRTLAEAHSQKGERNRLHELGFRLDGTCGSGLSSNGRGELLADKFDIEFDVVVAGAGSAGCVLATRLTENPAISLCLIEAGGRDRNPWIHFPLGFGKLVPNPNVNWGYETEPEPHLNGRRVSWPRGKVLGGSGSINGLVFLRGAPSDYDGWEAQGAKGWGYKDVLPYFKRMEHNVRGADAYRGQGGPDDHFRHQEALGDSQSLRGNLHAAAISAQPRFQWRAHRRRGHGPAQRAQWLALLDGGGLSQAQSHAQEPQADDANAGAADPF